MHTKIPLTVVTLATLTRKTSHPSMLYQAYNHRIPTPVVGPEAVIPLQTALANFM